MPKRTEAERKQKLKLILLGLSAQIIPLLFALYLSLHLLRTTEMRFELAMPLSIAWGAIGASIHYLSIKRGMKFRIIGTVLFLLLTIGAVFALEETFQIDHSKLKTCQVCGYKTLVEEKGNCPICDVTLNQAEAEEEGFDSIPELLFSSQIIFFMPTEIGGKVDFWEPIPMKIPYQKDPSWKPSVTVEEIHEVQALANTQNQ